MEACALGHDVILVQTPCQTWGELHLWNEKSAHFYEDEKLHPQVTPSSSSDTASYKMVVVLPGDVIANAAHASDQIKLGPGVLPTPDVPDTPASLTSIHTGALGHVVTKQRRRESRPATMHGWYVESAQRRYVPSVGDRVIAQVTNRGMESYTLTLFSAHPSTLPVLAFEGATRRNRPNLQIGALVYARVVNAEPWSEPELSCIDPIHNKADGMGELKATEPDVAMVWQVSLSLAQSMLRPQHTLLLNVSKHFAFEAAIGKNGLVWVRTAQAEHAIALGRVLAAADKSCQTHALASSGRGQGNGGHARDTGEHNDDMDVDNDNDDSDIDEANEHDERVKKEETPKTLHQRIRARGELRKEDIAELVRT